MNADSRNAHLAAARFSLNQNAKFLADARRTSSLLAMAMDQNRLLIALLQADADALASIVREHSATIGSAG